MLVSGSAAQERLTRGGRPPLDDRKALTGILFVLRSGRPREMLPQELGYGSGMTCWRRLGEADRFQPLQRFCWAL